MKSNLKPKLKALFLLFCVTLMTTFSVCAQEVRLNTYSSYAFDDDVDSYYSNDSFFKGTLQGGFLWGAGLEYKLNDSYGIELQYLRMNTQAPMTFATSLITTKTKVFDYGINYLLLGSNRFKKVADGKIELYGGLLIGMAIFDINNPEPGGASSVTKFAWSARAGLTYWLSERVGINTQLQLISIVQAVGAGVYFGNGGSGVGVNSYSSSLQFNMGGGLSFKLKK